jgi:ABC-type oligopeptide transport system substrate-binding subunit
MRPRSFRSGLIAGLLCLALVATGCGDDDDDGGGGGEGSETTQGGGSPSEEERVDCGQLEYDENAPTGGTFTDYAQLSSSGDNTSFDPGVVQTLDEAQVTTALFDGLTDFDFTEKCQPELKGNVAESWESNDDATEWTFQLKSGLTFTNGEPVNPSAFKRAWDRAANPALESPYGYVMAYIDGGTEVLEGEAEEISGIEADDENMTLKVTMDKPNADFPAIVVHSTFMPITEADAEQFSDGPPGWGTAGATIGNGPFMLESASEEEVVLVPNPDWAGNVYGDTEVKLARLIFKTTIDVESAYTTFSAGQGESGPVPPGKFGEAQEKYPNNTIDDPAMGSYFFDFGADSAVGGEENLKLRQAISMAINRDEINDKVYEGTRTISTGITPPGVPGFTRGLCEFCEYNPEEAKKLYDEWEADGGTLDGPLHIDFNEGGGHSDVGQIIQANLEANLGLETELNPIAEDYFRVIAEEGACGICRSGWYADYPTYGNFMVDLFGAVSIGGNNLGRYDDPEFEKLIAEAQGETDPVKRGELYADSERELLNADTHAIPLNWYTGDQVFRDTVVNADLPTLGIYLWERIAVES